MKKFAVPSMNLAASGFCTILAIALWWGGRVIAAFQWDTIYYPKYFLVQDLGARSCDMVAGVAPRMVCSPGHAWYSFGSILAGCALLVALFFLLRAYIAAQQPREASLLPDGRTLLMLAIGAGTVGVCLIVQGSTDSLLSARVVDTCFTIAIVVSWLLILWTTWEALRFQRLVHNFVPVFTKPAAIVALVLLVVSIVGFLLYVRAPMYSNFGLYQRLSIDSLALWALMLSASLCSTRLAVDDPQLAQAKEDS